MEATMEHPAAEEQLVAAPPKTVLFFSARRQLRLVVEAADNTYSPNGRKIGTTPGKTIQFTDAGTTGRYETADPTEAEWLRAHPLNGNPHEGIWEIVQTAPPVSAEELAAFAEAVTSFDVERLRTMLEQEGEGWGRAQLMDPLQTAIDRIEAAQAELDAARAG